MKIFFATLALSFLPVVASSQSVNAQDAPRFLRDIAPQGTANLSWQDYMAVMKPDGALDTKTKELIGLAVAAQIPCQYCIYAHTLGARHAGATDAQIKEAVAASALVRKLSTELNGNQYDLSEFKKQIDAAYGAPKTE
jgi:AhpD family alkylhydroperoxidase